MKGSVNSPNSITNWGVECSNTWAYEGHYPSNQHSHQDASLKCLLETFRIAHFWQERKENRREKNRTEELSMMFCRHISVLSQSIRIWQYEHIAHSVSWEKEVLDTFCFSVCLRAQHRSLYWELTDSKGAWYMVAEYGSKRMTPSIFFLILY